MLCQDQVAHSKQTQYSIAYEATTIVILLPARQQYSKVFSYRMIPLFFVGNQESLGARFTGDLLPDRRPVMQASREVTCCFIFKLDARSRQRRATCSSPRRGGNMLGSMVCLT
ncbi:hypothetical protein VFPPC_18297 [Pochonia chlamydosporia 170]|uniref:Uncharacterized protein n=1 Tax=Pochonia chlamydosporia 170 TaxID=1380566 RepID=A0A219AP03_METCM|nr:hypothetical protein VFPPC_18297 [Pochonia chlamydosporia 170]OWT42558.1 hypothetical protein VFPPC_18297 [Pochonia chlamydosporia 170]